MAAPIIAGGRTWGALFVLSVGEPLDAEHRLRGFAELVALTLESAEAPDQLTASRTRIADAAMAERRRLERNLHDGAQQQLVTLALHLRMAQESLRDDPAAAETMLIGVGEDLKLALAELRELARGLHPAILTDRGLAPALKTVANRAPFRVDIVGVPAYRLSEPVEAAVYYVVAESLTNAAKHAGATEAHVELSITDETVVVEGPRQRERRRERCLRLWSAGPRRSRRGTGRRVRAAQSCERGNCRAGGASARHGRLT